MFTLSTYLTRKVTWSDVLLVVILATFCTLFWAFMTGAKNSGYLAFMQFSDEDLAKKRHQMVEWQIKRRQVRNPRVLEAMQKVERHKFVPASYKFYAYEDSPLPIGYDQTISQPYIVALMTELIDPQKDDKVLEIGTGSGYQAAVLGELVKEVYTIEIVKPLGKRATDLLRSLGYENIHVKIGDGYQGWPDKAPFDKVIVTAAPEKVPEPLIQQLKVGGRLVIPVGRSGNQDLRLYTKEEDGLKQKSIIPVRFVPMTGEIQKKE